MHNKKRIIAALVFLCLFAVWVSSSLAASDGVTELRSLVTTYENVPFILTFTQSLRMTFTTSGSYMNVTEHYNSGMRNDVIYYPFSWNVVPAYFRWYENGVQVREFNSFSDYARFYDPEDRPWGGRNLTSVNFYLPGNYHGANIRSIYQSNSTTPNMWMYNLSYGQSGLLAAPEVTLSSTGNEITNAASEHVIQQSKKAGKGIIATVNGKGIPERRIELLVQLSNAFGTERSHEEVIHDLVLSELCHDEAIRRGLQVSEEKAEAFANETRANLWKAENSQEFGVILDTILASLQMTEEEYWKWTVMEYKKLLSVGNLRASFIGKDGAFDAEGFETLGSRLYKGASITIGRR